MREWFDSLLLPKLWDNAPPGWYLVFVSCAYLGIVTVYAMWKKYGGYHSSDDDKD